MTQIGGNGGTKQMEYFGSIKLLSIEIWYADVIHQLKLTFRTPNDGDKTYQVCN
jgi:hypothetical protein